MEFPAGYVHLREGKVARTVEAAGDIMVDVDADGRITGIETLGYADWRNGLVALAIAGRLRVT